MEKFICELSSHSCLYSRSCKKLKIQLDGVIIIEEAKAIIKRNGRYIILLHEGDNTGDWVCYDRGSYFDSFGEPPSRSLLKFVKMYNRKQYQAVELNFCGQWCLLWLYSRQYNRPDLLDQISDLNY
ncbi:hypothetical protein Plhal710r2_c041g0142131 [Plasmopara halstedii]